MTCVDPKFAWNHGDFQDEIANTWLGVVGPGVENNGIDTTTWTDHVDVRPTINAILGLGDDYVNDGRVITQILDNQATPKGLHQHGNTTADLGAMYKQINAPFGKFALDTLVASTSALKQENTAAGNLKYDSIEAQIANLTAQRNVVAGSIRDALNNAAKGRDPRREQCEELDRPGSEAARCGRCPQGRFVGDRNRFTSEGSSSRQAPGSSPPSVSGP